MTRGHWILAIFLAGSLTAAGVLTYKRWPQLLGKTSNQRPTTSFNHNELSSVPPFSTKEPERYQATRIITSVEYKSDSALAPATVSSKVWIARDGDRRREEYQTGVNETVVYLETAEGRFILSPSKKLYADLNTASGDLDSFTSQSDANAADHPRGVAPPGTSGFSPDRLLNETRALARYEKLGAETINERVTTKYRVTTEDKTNGSGDGSVTLIWVDDALGMPIRSETSSSASDHRTKLTVELRDLAQTIDSRIFELPKDYLKVNYRRLFAEMPPIPGARSGEKSKSEKP